jgi:hypothetical protein
VRVASCIVSVFKELCPVARIRGVYLRKPPKGPSSYTSKEAALAAAPTMLVADAAFPKNRMDSVKNAAFRVNSGGRGEWSPNEFFAVWEYARDVVLRVKADGGEGSVEVIGFEQEGEVIGEDGDPVGALDDLLQEEGVERGGWVLLIGVQPNVPEGWEETVNAPGSRKRRKRGSGS